MLSPCLQAAAGQVEAAQWSLGNYTAAFAAYGWLPEQFLDTLDMARAPLLHSRASQVVQALRHADCIRMHSQWQVWAQVQRTTDAGHPQTLNTKPRVCSCTPRKLAIHCGQSSSRAPPHFTPRPQRRATCAPAQRCCRRCKRTTAAPVATAPCATSALVRFFQLLRCG
jgi:hypothetical protein